MVKRPASHVMETHDQISQDRARVFSFNLRNLRHGHQNPFMHPHPYFTRARWFVILLAWFCGGAISFAAAAPNYFVRRWEAGNGLPSNNVRALVQTRDGYLWVGTSSGLVR